jgi:hypothetical protein
MKIRTTMILIISAASFVSSQELTGPQIVARVNELLNPETSWARLRMSIQTSSGGERSFIYESWSKNYSEKNLIRYLEPSRVKGQSTLLLNNADDIWMFFPRTNRVRKLATHAKKQKMEGSDFSYEDMGSSNSFVKNYTSNRLEDKSIDGQPCYQVELLKNKGADVSYSRLLMFIRQDNFVPVRIEYFDENHPDRLLKTLIQSSIQTIQGIPTAQKMRMVNDIDQTETRLEFLEIKYHIEIGDEWFTERGMKQ